MCAHCAPAPVRLRLRELKSKSVKEWMLKISTIYRFIFLFFLFYKKRKMKRNSNGRCACHFAIFHRTQIYSHVKINKTVSVWHVPKIFYVQFEFSSFPFSSSSSSFLFRLLRKTIINACWTLSLSLNRQMKHVIPYWFWYFA